MGLQELNQKLLDLQNQTQLAANYQKTLMLLAGLKSGSIDLEDFVMVGDGWSLVMPKPEEPAVDAPKLYPPDDAAVV